MRSKSKVVKNRVTFWTFFALPNFVGGGTQKSYLHYHACPLAGHMTKFREVIPTSPKVIGTHMLNFEPNFKCSP